MQVGTTEDQGLYNKPSAAVQPGALAAGNRPQYNTMHIGSSLRFPVLVTKIRDSRSHDE